MDNIPTFCKKAIATILGNINNDQGQFQYCAYFN